MSVIKKPDLTDPKLRAKLAKGIFGITRSKLKFYQSGTSSQHSIYYVYYQINY